MSNYNSREVFDRLKMSSEEIVKDVEDSAYNETSSHFHKISIKINCIGVDSFEKTRMDIDNMFQYITAETTIDEDSNLIIKIIDDSGHAHNFLKDLLYLSKSICYYIDKKKLPDMSDPYMSLDYDESLGVLDINVMNAIARLKEQDRPEHPSYNDVEKVVNKWFKHII